MGDERWPQEGFLEEELCQRPCHRELSHGASLSQGASSGDPLGRGEERRASQSLIVSEKSGT